MKSIVNSTLGRFAAVTVAAALAAGPIAARADDDDRGRRGRGGNPLRNIALTGTTDDNRAFSGRFDITGFQLIGDTVYAIGNLNGRVAGQRPVQQLGVAIPVEMVDSAAASGGFGSRSTDLKVQPASYSPSAGRLNVVPAQLTCPVLNLALGPLDLDLLGLVVHLDPVLLTIDAVAGPGNLLGNLLCGLVGILDGFALLAFLQQLLAILNNLPFFG